MRKFLSISIVLVLAISLMGVVSLAKGSGPSDEDTKVAQKFDLPDDWDGFVGYLEDALGEEGLTYEDFEGAELGIVVSPPVDGSYELVTRKDNKVLVLVDPIHVTE
ncbi:MAG: hypothetical protein ACLFVS_07690 [Candidatus Acetothermia bacterium]